MVINAFFKASFLLSKILVKSSEIVKRSLKKFIVLLKENISLFSFENIDEYLGNVISDAYILFLSGSREVSSLVPYTLMT